MGKIVINTTEKPSTAKLNELIKWFCVELGFLDYNSKEDEENIDINILKEFILAAYNNEDGITSLKLKEKLKYPLARSTLIYHLNKIIESGLIVKKGRKYYLRGRAMSKAVEELEYDLEREFSKMIDTARELDNLMLKSQRLKVKNQK
ncbi:MAG: hypothetical protein ACP5LH_00945 [Candidatus Micrarchaeia archaeon]